MNREEFSDKGSRLGGGGYFSSMDEMESPRHRAMHALLTSLHDKKPKKFLAAIKNVQQEGWDINKIVFQDSLQSWFTLGSYLASRPDVLLGRLYSTYLDIPGIDLSTQEAQVTSKYFRYNMRGKEQDPTAFASIHQTSRVPLAHAFLRQWAQHLRPLVKRTKFLSNWERKGYEKSVVLHGLATELFDKMNKCGTDWTVKDEHGNGICHVLVERESSQTLGFLLPWMKSLGVSMSQTNNMGMTPSVSAHQRLARASANGSNAAEGHQEFRSTLALLEQGLLQDSTPQAPSARPSRRF